MLDQFCVPNGTHFSFISNYIFLKKECIMFTTRARTLTCLHQNKILCIDSSPRLFKVEMKTSRRLFLNNVFLSSKRLIWFSSKYDMASSLGSLVLISIIYTIWQQVFLLKKWLVCDMNYQNYEISRNYKMHQIA